MSNVKDDAELLLLKAESLERQMVAQGASPEALIIIDDLATAASDLFDLLSASVAAREGTG